MLIVDSVLKAENTATLASIEDTRNMLSAFRWNIPASYWQNRCRKDLIIEFKQLMSNDTSVDWQFLCLGSKELLLNHRWYDRSGLKNRERILPLLEGMKRDFLVLLEQRESSEHEVLPEVS